MAHIFFDFDSTLVSIETLDLLVEEHIKNDPEKISEIHKITTAGMNGNLPLFDSLTRRIKQVKIEKCEIDKFSKTILNFITPNIKEIITELQNKGHTIYILSGGFKDYMYLTAEALKIKNEHVFGNTFTYNNKGIVTGFSEQNPLCKNEGKAHIINQLNLKEKIIMVGDGYTDLEVFNQKSCDAFIGFGLHIKRDNIKDGAPHYAENINSFRRIIGELTANR